jgi:hypothetical protein
MYAHLNHANPGPASATQPSQPGLLGSITFKQLAGSAGACLTLWDTEASADAFGRQHGESTGLPGEIYEVTDTREGQAAGQVPAYAQLTYFDGPSTPELAEAADVAGRLRIWPAVRGISGLVGVYVLRARDLGRVVITVATSVETLEAGQRALLSTELMPGEDPALLPGPDRIEIHHVTGYGLSATASAASAKAR